MALNPHEGCLNTYAPCGLHCVLCQHLREALQGQTTTCRSHAPGALCLDVGRPHHLLQLLHEHGDCHTDRSAGRLWVRKCGSAGQSSAQHELFFVKCLKTLLSLQQGDLDMCGLLGFGLTV